MKFKMQFDMDNAAFEDSPTEEVIRILGEVGDQVGDGNFSGPIADLNGNRVGSFEIEA